MIKRICDLLIRMLEKHGELVLAWNGVKTAFYRLNSACQNGITNCLKTLKFQTIRTPNHLLNVTAAMGSVCQKDSI